VQVTKAITKLKFFQEKLQSSEDGTAAAATAAVAEPLSAAAAAVADAKQQLQDSSDSGQAALTLSTTALDQLAAASDAAAEHTAALVQGRAAVAAAAAEAEAAAAAAEAAEQQRLAEAAAERQRVIEACQRRAALMTSGMQLLKAREQLARYSAELQWRCGAESSVLLDGLTGREVTVPTRKRARVALCGPLSEERWRLSNGYFDGYNGYSWCEEEGEFCSKGGYWEFAQPLNDVTTATSVDAEGQPVPVLCRLPSEIVVCGNGEARDDSDAFSDRYDEAAAAADDVDGMVIVEPVYSAAVLADLDTLAATTAAADDDDDDSSSAAAVAPEQAEAQEADSSGVQHSSSEQAATAATAAAGAAAAASDDAAARAEREQELRQLALNAMRKRKLQS
jgi:hypothetical protein